jgi:hypothetical protein
MNYREIPFFPTHIVSECGTSIRSKITGRHVRFQNNIVKGKVSGYIYASLCRPNKVRRVSVHRCVCEAFHGPAPIGKPWVNHKDGDKGNNHASNLEWTSISENIQHAFDTGLKRSKSGAEHHMYGRLVKKETRQKMSAQKMGIKHPKFKGFYLVDGVQYPSANQAAKYLNISAKTISNRCKIKPNQYPNFAFIPVK